MRDSTQMYTDNRAVSIACHPHQQCDIQHAFTAHSESGPDKVLAATGASPELLPQLLHCFVTMHEHGRAFVQRRDSLRQAEQPQKHRQVFHCHCSPEPEQAFMLTGGWSFVRMSVALPFISSCSAAAAAACAAACLAAAAAAAVACASANAMACCAASACRQ